MCWWISTVTSNPPTGTQTDFAVRPRLCSSSPANAQRVGEELSPPNNEGVHKGEPHQTNKQTQMAVTAHTCDLCWRRCLPLPSLPLDGSSFGPQPVPVRDTRSNPESRPPRAVPQSRSGRSCRFLKLLQPLRHEDDSQSRVQPLHSGHYCFSLLSGGDGGSVWNL